MSGLTVSPVSHMICALGLDITQNETIQWQVLDFPSGGEVPTYDFAKISRKLHEIERICPPP